ncbi:hypothetical protein ACXJJ3_10400 [Kribbella sp. WER1]
MSRPDEPTRGGNVLGLAVVAGLFAFFVADTLRPAGNAAVAFLAAVGTVLVLFLVVATVLLTLARRRAKNRPPAGELARKSLETVFDDLLSAMAEPSGAADDRLPVDLALFLSAPPAEGQAALDALLRPERRRLHGHLVLFARLLADAPQGEREKLLEELLGWMESQ